MDLRTRLLDVKARAQAAAWRLKTSARVYRSTGIARAVKPAGLATVLREAARGRLNASLIFRYHASNSPHAIALIGPAGAHGSITERAYSFFELNDAIDRIAAGLASIGIRKGEAVLVSMKNRPEFIIAQAAIGRLGASAVSVSWRSTPPELEYIANHSHARALFFDSTIESTIAAALPNLPNIQPTHAISVGGKVSTFPTWNDILTAGSTFEEASADAAVVMYTSGTTGKPKGAVRKFQREVLAHVLSFIEQTPMIAGETHLVTCPLYHATAFGFTSFTYILGGSVVVMGDFKPETFLETVERYRITTTAVVPTMLHRILELGPDKIRKYDLTSLKVIFSGGAPLSATLARDVLDTLGDKLYNFYGATETGLVTLAGPSDLRASPGTIGRVVPGQELRLFDDDGRDVPDGSVGELFARSEQLVAGYHADETATRGSMRDGFFSVGDLARRDARGCYHIEGRKRDMIISGGINVYPAEVEAVLDEHPAVLESAVVGIPDREWGERVRAYVVLRADSHVSAEDLTAFCAGRIAKTKLPREIRFLEHLPRNPTGKVLKRELRLVE
ncbi:MAG: AMP-binding protein [Polyangiaceae bacterium]|nr:AMP-binding protein [Polyangiaceae bacterium]